MTANSLNYLYLFIEYAPQTEAPARSLSFTSLSGTEESITRSMSFSGFPHVRGIYL